MTGPEHYQRAEELLLMNAPADPLDWMTYRVALAQVHATLALAATALGAARPDSSA
jgi:hypothetical protein